MGSAVTGVLVALDPQVVVGDKVVRVRKPDFGGTLDVLEEIEKSKLPLPDLQSVDIGDLLKESADQLRDLGANDEAQGHQIYAAQEANALRIRAAIAKALAANMEVVRRWLFGCRPVLFKAVCVCSNLEAEEVRSLELLDVYRIFKTAWAMLKNSGMKEEFGSFFAARTDDQNPSDAKTESVPTVAG
jgi:hypothetical protein